MQDYIFFSYSHVDKNLLEYYEINLTKVGYNIVYDKEMSAGDFWNDRAKNYIRSEECKCVVFLISDASAISKPVLTELEYVRRYEKKFFAILLDGENLQNKFKRMNASREYTSDQIDIIDTMRDFFPEEKLYVTHDAKSIDSVIKALEAIPELKKREVNVIANSTSMEHIKEKDLSKDFTIVLGKDVTKKDIEEALDLDRRFYDLKEEDMFTLEKCIKWFNINPHIYTMLRDNRTNKIVAYINAAPVTDECYEDIKAGKYADAKIDDDDIESFEIAGFYNLYFASVVVDLEYKNLFLLQMVYNAFIDNLLKLLDKDFIITRIIADAVSKKGKKFCEIFGLNKVISKTGHNSTIYEAILFPPQIKVTSKKAKQVYDSYKKKGEEFGYI